MCNCSSTRADPLCGREHYIGPTHQEGRNAPVSGAFYQNMPNGRFPMGDSHQWISTSETPSQTDFPMRDGAASDMGITPTVFGLNPKRLLM